MRQARKKCARPRTVHSMGCASLCEEENRQVPLQVPPLTTSFSLHTLLALRVHAVPSAQEREWGPRSYTATVQSDRAGLSELQAHGRPPTQVFPSADGTTATPAELLGGGGDVCMTLIAVPGTNRHAICDCWHCTPTDTWLSMTSSRGVCIFCNPDQRLTAGTPGRAESIRVLGWGRPDHRAPQSLCRRPGVGRAEIRRRNGQVCWAC